MALVGKIVIVCSSLFQITEKLIDLINSNACYAMLCFSQRQIHINLRPSVILQSSPQKYKPAHAGARHKAEFTIHTQSQFSSLAQMSGLLVAFRGIKSISAQVTAILQKPVWNTSQFTLIMYPSRRPGHAYAALPAVFSHKYSGKGGKM